MKYACLITVSPSWDFEFHYSPIKVFIGDNEDDVRRLACEEAETLRNMPEHRGDFYSVDDIEVVEV